MLKKILIALVVVIGVFVVVVAMQPSEFRIVRTAALSAPASAVFAQVNDLHNWNAWDPWAKLDPESKDSFEGSPAGVGAILRWAGNKKVGEGSMTILESKPDELVRIKLEFLKPFKATNTTEFTFAPQGDQTLVTWSMFGEKSFMCKAMSLLMNCDKKVGEQFEKGLSNLKAVTETPAA